MAQQDSRIKVKRSTVTTTEPTAAPSSDHTDGTWTSADLYVGELFLNTADDRLWIRTDAGIKEIAIGAGQMFKGQLAIATADVLTSNATPLTWVSGIVGKELICIQATISTTFGTTAYATNVGVAIRNTGAVGDQLNCIAGLSMLSSLKSTFEDSSGVSTGNVVTGANLEFYTRIGDPTAGDSDIVIDYTYIIRNIP